MNDYSNRIVLITNVKKAPDSGYKKHMSQYDFVMNITNKLLARSIRKNGYDVIEYNELNDFVKNIESHKKDLVFPYHHGISSKIRQSFVQSFCENYKIRYIGGDAYSQTIGNDKALSKEICRHSGIYTPNCKILFDKNYPPDVSALKLPLIVKPQFEGDSIGISDSNVFHSAENVISFAIKLMEDLNQPVLIEEYIEGKEISISIVGYKRNIKKIGVIEYTIPGSLVKNYWNKKFNLNFGKFKLANHLLNEHIVDKITNLFHSLDKIEFMRLDFIYKSGNFYNIELTADPTLSSLSAMYSPFRGEMSFTEFIGLLISNSIERYASIAN